MKPNLLFSLVLSVLSMCAAMSSIVRAQQLDFTIVATPSSPVPLGTTVVAAITGIQNGTPPYTYAWTKCCPNALCPFVLNQPDTKHFCMDSTPVLQIKASVTDGAGKNKKKHIDVTVLPPNGAALVDNPDSTNGPPLFVVHQTFHFLVDSEPLGPCYNNCVYEKIALKEPLGPWESDPVDWQLTSCPDAPAPGFYYSAPLLHDFKTYTLSPREWVRHGLGDLLYEYKQWIGIKIAVCPEGPTVPEEQEPTIFEHGPFHFKVYKIGSNTLRHVLQE